MDSNQGYTKKAYTDTVHISKYNGQTFTFESNKKVFMEIMKLFKPYIKKIILMLVCMIIYSAITLVIPLINKRLMDEGVLVSNMTNVIKYSLILLSFTIVGQAISMAETKFASHLNTIVPYDLSKIAFKKTLELKMEYLNNINFAELMSNLGMDINNISSLLNRQSFFIISQIFSIVGGTIGLFLISWKLSLIIIALIPVRYFIVKYLAKKRKSLFEEFMTSSREYSGWYGDTVSGIKEIKLLGVERIKIGEFIKKQRYIIKTNIRMFFLDKINISTENIILQIISTIIYILGAYMVIKNNLTIGGMFAFATYSMNVMVPVSSILGIGYNFANVIPSAKRFFQFLNTECEEKERDKKIRLDNNFRIENIKYENISFSYNKGQTLINNVSFQIERGEKVAIIGLNGAGKSTLLNLLLRLYIPGEGKISINGVDISAIRLSDYRKLFSVVNQDFYLFNKSIKDNIGIRSNVSDEDIYKASKQSGAFDFIDNLDKKFESNIGNNGVKLSGGERQKLALARALVSGSDIILFDEATSNIDYETENKINEVIVKEIKDKTVLLVSHKPKILEYMDKIIILEDGCIKNIGTYDELYKKGVLTPYIS